MTLNSWFERGISKADYMADLEKHRDNFMKVYQNFQVPSADVASLKGRPTRIIALAEVWCGHCMMDVPIMLKMAEAFDIPVAFLPRDQHLELMDQYLTHNKRYIPIFIFIDEAGNEVSKWGPWAPEVDQLTKQLKEEVPNDKDDPHYQAAFKKYIEEIEKHFTKDDTYWQYVYEDIKNKLP